MSAASRLNFEDTKMDSDDDFDELARNAEFQDFDEFSNAELIFSTSASSVISSNQNSPRPIQDQDSDWPGTVER